MQGLRKTTTSLSPENPDSGPRFSNGTPENELLVEFEVLMVACYEAGTTRLLCYVTTRTALEKICVSKSATHYRYKECLQSRMGSDYVELASKSIII